MSTMIPPPLAGSASPISILLLPDNKRCLGTAEVGVQKKLCLEADHGPTFWWDQQEVVG